MSLCPCRCPSRTVSEERTMSEIEQTGRTSRRSDRAGRSRRRKRSIIARVAVIVVLAAAAVAGWLWMSTRSDATARLDEAFERVEKADVTVVSVDEVVREEVTTQTATRAEQAKDGIATANELLEKAIAAADDVRPKLDEDGRADARVLVKAAQARLAMLEQAPLILDLNIKASKALVAGAAGWAKVLEADKATRAAAAEYNKLTKVGVTASATHNKTALTALTAARASFDEAEKAFPEAPFETYLAYVDARIALVKLSQQSDALWLKGDVAGANKIIASYNVADKKAVEQGKALPASPETAIADAYEAAAKEATEAYYAARDEAIKADKGLRDR